MLSDITGGKTTFACTRNRENNNIVNNIYLTVAYYSDYFQKKVVAWIKVE